MDKEACCNSNIDVQNEVPVLSIPLRTYKPNVFQYNLLQTIYEKYVGNPVFLIRPIFVSLSIVMCISYAHADELWFTQTPIFDSSTYSGAIGMNALDENTSDSVPPYGGIERPIDLLNSIRIQNLIDGGKLRLLFRNYSEDLQVDAGISRHAWVQGMQAVYESGFTEGKLGFGFDASLFTAAKLDGGQGAGNMTHTDADGGGQNQIAWAYLGDYVIKAQMPGILMKYGLQSVSNPFLQPYDIRVLPPAFKGISLVGDPFDELSIKAGSFDAVDARATTYLQSLSTSYGGIDFNRITYLGGDWKYSGDGKLTLYANRSQNIWNQYYAALSQGIGDVDTIKWTGRGDIYYTRDQGADLQGAIDNKSYSLSLTAQHGASSVLLGYQRILGDQFF